MTIGTLADPRCGRVALPVELARLVARLERFDLRGDDLERRCDDATARELTDALWRRARVLAAEGRITVPLPRTADAIGRELTPAQIAKVIAVVVANGFVFDRARTFSLSGARRLVRQASRLFGGSGLRGATRAVAGAPTPAVCLDFATATRTLFYALKRATGAVPRVFAPVIYGPAVDLTDPARQHAWNWLVDVDARSICAFDVSRRGVREGDLEIALGEYRNVSAFLATVHGAAQQGVFDLVDARDLLHAAIEPTVERGQLLLFHFAGHLATPVNLRRWIAMRLERDGFARVVPGFRDELDRLDHGLGRVGRLVFAAGSLEVLPGADPGC